MRFLTPAKRIRFGSLLLNIALLVMLLPAVAFAQDCIPSAVSTADEAIEQLDILREDQCLGDRNCKTILCIRITEFEKNWVEAPFSQENITEAADLIRTIRQESYTLPDQGVGKAQLLGMFEEWNSLITAVGEMKDGSQITDSVTLEWKPDVLILFSGTDYKINLEETFNDLCVTAAQCQETFTSATKVYGHSIMMHRILKMLITSDLAEFGKYLERLDQRWRTFHNTSRAIYPWELWFNGLYYRPRQEGFSEPPQSQILLLHPSAGLAFQEFKDDDKLQEAIIVDVVGFYRWKWGGRNEAEVKKPFGLALTTSWDGDDISYGASVHLPKNWSVGVVSTDDGDISVLLSLDFGNFIMDKNKSVNNLRQKLKSH